MRNPAPSNDGTGLRASAAGRRGRWQIQIRHKAEYVPGVTRSCVFARLSPPGPDPHRDRASNSFLPHKKEAGHVAPPSRVLTAAGAAYSLEHARRYFIKALPAPFRKLNNLSAHFRIPSIHSVARTSECGSGALANVGKLTAQYGKLTARAGNVAR